MVITRRACLPVSGQPWSNSSPTLLRIARACVHHISIPRTSYSLSFASATPSWELNEGIRVQIIQESARKVG